MHSTSSRGRPRLRRWFRASARNALELARFGRLGEDFSTPYEIIDRGAHHRVRRYATGAPPDAPVVLLVPPLMLAAEVYDIAPDVSAVSVLGKLGVQPYVIDFGAPEREAGGMRRSLDDHVRGVSAAIDRIREVSGRDVHLCGYSQGGMFAYQTAAYRRGASIKSIVTFGSPVDIHRGLPALRSDVAAMLVRSLSPAVETALAHIEGLPGVLTSTAFKVVSTRKELRARIDFVRRLHDRNALLRSEARRRFLGGAGFVAWPGPAFRAFVDEFIVHNRMLSGGFVIDGRSVTLADITCPILAFLGATDEIARAPTVRAITDAAPDADVHFVSVPAGHFGIVVGSRATNLTWPTVAQWVLHQDGLGETPEAIRPRASAERLDDDPELGGLDTEVELFVDAFTRSTRALWRRLGDSVASAGDAADAVRYQEPRLRRLERLQPDTRISASRELAECAKRTPAATFFLFAGRAFSYADADARVSNVARGLFRCGVRHGERVAIVMQTRPSLLSATTALGRLGAVSVVAPPDASLEALRSAFEEQGVTRVISDPERAGALRRLGCEVLVLGGGPGRTLEPGVVDMEAIDPGAITLPEDMPLDAGRARDLAMVLLRPGEGSALRAVPITNHRWALSALGAAAACTIKSRDTLYCAVPLHHPTGLLVSTGAALVGGARLALGDARDPKVLLADVRRTGATIVMYAGEMLRPLLDEPATRADRRLPVRLFAGSGMRPDLAAHLRERFGVGTIEFYAGTAHRAILAEPSGDKPGALGRVLPGSAEIALVRCDLARGEVSRDASGRLTHAGADEPALLAARVGDDERDALGDQPGLVRGAFAEGDAWIVTRDVVEQDDDGDLWFVDALGNFVATPAGPVSTRRVEDAIYAIPGVTLAAAWGDGEEAPALVAAYVAATPINEERLTGAFARLPEHARPTVVVRVPELPLGEGFRPRRADLPRLAAAASACDRWRWDGARYIAS